MIEKKFFSIITVVLNAKDDLITHLENIINSLDESTQIKMLRKLGLLKKKPS